MNDLEEARKLALMLEIKELATELVASIKPSDLALISVHVPIQYSTKERSRIKHKGGRPPIDYAGVEVLADLEAELNREKPDLYLVCRNYFILQNLLRG